MMTDSGFNFIDAYMAWTHDSESHEDYRRLVSYAALSTACSRRLILKAGSMEIVPNIFVLLVGPSASRKTSAMSPMKRILDKIGIELGPDSTTPQGLYFYMSLPDQIQSITYKGETSETRFSFTPLWIDELSQFLGTGIMSDVGKEAVLINLFDANRHSNKRFLKGSMENKNESGRLEEVPGGTLTLIAATTQDWLRHNINATLKNGGFISRFICAFSDGPQKLNAYPEERNPIIERALAEHLRVIASRTDILRLTNEAMEWGREWYYRFHSEPRLNVLTNPGGIPGLRERRQVYVHKMATLNALAENPYADRIHVRHMESAEKFLDDNERVLQSVFGGHTVADEALLRTVILELIAEHEAIETKLAVKAGRKPLPTDLLIHRNRLMRLVTQRYSSRMSDIREAISGLEDIGSIVKYATPNGDPLLGLKK